MRQCLTKFLLTFELGALLSRINGFHLYDLLHAQQFLLVRVFGKGGHLAAFFIINFRSSNLGLFGFPLQAHARKKKES